MLLGGQLLSKRELTALLDWAETQVRHTSCCAYKGRLIQYG